MIDAHFCRSSGRMVLINAAQGSFYKMNNTPKVSCTWHGKALASPPQWILERANTPHTKYVDGLGASDVKGGTCSGIRSDIALFSLGGAFPPSATPSRYEHPASTDTALAHLGGARESTFSMMRNLL